MRTPLPIRLALAAALAAPVAPLALASPSRAATAPSCVVSLSPTATETLFAIGAGRQVQAVDKDSNFPTRGLPRQRVDALNPSVESLIGICRRTTTHRSAKPDLVIISYDANSIKEKLSALGVRVVEQDAPTTLTGALNQIRTLGHLTGHVAAAYRLAASIRRHIAADVASVPSHPGRPVSVYYELDPTFYSLTSSTFVGSLLARLGTTNIADAQSSAADGGYPQLSAEYIVSADPQLVLLADTKCCHASPTTVAARPGFSTVAAVADGHVVNLDDDIASRWGPRLGLLMDALTKAVKAALADSRLWNG